MFKQTNKQWDLLICGDTIIWHKGKIIEKPVYML
jgi:predicted house-cleaning NTP pyrophosphatase (Maf/HAM1 superfamily)